MHVSADLVAKVEKALRWPTATFTTDCETALDTGGALARLLPLVELERKQERAMATATARAVRTAVAHQRRTAPSLGSTYTDAPSAAADLTSNAQSRLAAALPGVQLTARLRHGRSTGS